jgi:PAS domain S-box-containing protein
VKPDARHGALDSLQSAVFSSAHWREEFLRLVLLAAAALGLAAAVPSIIDVVRSGNAGLGWIYGAAWIIVLALAVFRWPYSLRAGAMLALTYALAVSGLMENGMRGDARLFFLALSIMTAMLVNIRVAFVVTGASLLTIGIVGILALGGAVRLLSKVTPVGSVELWVVSTLDLALLQSVVLTGLLLFLREFSGAQEKLRESFNALARERTLLRTVIDNIPDPIYAKDASGRRQLANRADAALLRAQDVSDVLGKTGAELLPDDAAERLMAEDHQVLRTGEPVINREFPMTGPDGRARWLLVSKLPLRSPSGEITGMVGIDRDITERKRAEGERARLEEQLRLAQRMESMGRLAGGLAHDINNLLTPLLGYSELILESVDNREELREGLAQIKGAAKRTRDLLRQLLAFGGRQALAMAPVDLREAVRAFGKLLRRTIRDDVGLEIVFPDELDPVIADVSALEQVLLNLVLNAQEAMPTGGQIVIELANRPAAGGGQAGEPPGIAAGAYVVLLVRDTGVGMDAETVTRVFEPFFSTKPRGTGLGLATVYGLVQQHGGSVAVTSQPGQGTAFAVWLPRLAAAAGATPPSTEDVRPSVLRGGSETILVVEDDDVLRDLAVRVLQRLGYRVVAARGGPEALEVASSSPAVVDLLLADVVMAGMSGPELSRRLSAVRPGMKTVLMSGYTPDVLARSGIGHDDALLLRKPFLPDDLAVVVRRILDGQD